jgi:hypothetical protein
MNLIIKQCKLKKYIICIIDEIKINQVKEERENPSLQIKVNRVLWEFDEAKTKQILQHLQIQRKKWHFHNSNALSWYFYCVNDNLKIKLDVPQMMRC